MAHPIFFSLLFFPPLNLLRRVLFLDQYGLLSDDAYLLLCDVHTVLKNQLLRMSRIPKFAQGVEEGARFLPMNSAPSLGTCLKF
jgi:hypothetical protein